MKVRRGDIYFVDLSPVVGSEQGGTRPVIVIQNNIGNDYSPTVIVAAITSQIGKTRLPTHVDLPGALLGLQSDSVVLLEQLRTIDKRRLRRRLTHLGREWMARIDQALHVSLALDES